MIDEMEVIISRWWVSMWHVIGNMNLQNVESIALTFDWNGPMWEWRQLKICFVAVDMKDNNHVA